MQLFPAMSYFNIRSMRRFAKHNTSASINRVCRVCLTTRLFLLRMQYTQSLLLLEHSLMVYLLISNGRFRGCSLQVRFVIVEKYQKQLFKWLCEFTTPNPMYIFSLSDVCMNDYNFVLDGDDGQYSVGWVEWSRICRLMRTHHVRRCGTEFTLVNLYSRNHKRYRVISMEYKLTRVNSVLHGCPWSILFLPQWFSVW